MLSLNMPWPTGKAPTLGLDPRNCKVCGSRFQPYRDPQVTCSRRCHDRLPARKALASEYGKRPDVKERKNAARRIANNPERRDYNLRRNLKYVYGIEFEQYEQMLADQKLGCAICGFVPPPGGVKAASRLHVDHDHETGKVRALLCNGCNRGLGYLGDDPKRLRDAADYIEKFKEKP